MSEQSLSGLCYIYFFPSCMIETLEVLWQRGSRIGLREDEGVHDKREVIFANRLLLSIPVLLLFYLPFELALNGTDASHLVLLFMAVLLAPLLFNRWRWFAFSRYFRYIAAILFTTLAGLAVG